MGIIISRHEPWFDEAQAWLLARDASPWDLFSKYLRYEGSPGLWHLLLMLPAKLGMPYITLNILAGVIAVAGVYVFLRYSPFPAFIKVLFPFTYFIFFQYAVVARSYVLMPLLMFALASVYSRRQEKTYTYMLLLCLIASLNLHGFLFSSSILLINFIEIIVRWRSLNWKIRIRYAVAYLIYGVLTILTILMLMPPADLLVGQKVNTDKIRLLRFMPAAFGDSLVTNLKVTDVIYRIDYFGLNFRQLYFNIPGLLILITLLVSFVWFIRKRVLFHYLLPCILLTILFAMRYVNEWHVCIMFLIWVFTMWISFEDENPGLEFNLKKFNIKEFSVKKLSFPVISRWAILVVFVFIIARQMDWAYQTSANDFSYNYSASRTVAEFIKANGFEGKKIYCTAGHSTSIQPYFSKNIFMDFNDGKQPSFFLWKKSNILGYSLDSFNMRAVAAQNPDLVIIGVKFDEPEYCMKKIPPGYESAGLVDGNIYWKNTILEPDGFLLCVKKGTKLKTPLQS